MSRLPGVARDEPDEESEGRARPPARAEPEPVLVAQAVYLVPGSCLWSE
jgi:hypothetical protein